MLVAFFIRPAAFFASAAFVNPMTAAYLLRMAWATKKLNFRPGNIRRNLKDLKPLDVDKVVQIRLLVSESQFLQEVESGIGKKGFLSVPAASARSRVDRWWQERKFATSVAENIAFAW